MAVTLKPSPPSGGGRPALACLSHTCFMPKGRAARHGSVVIGTASEVGSGRKTLPFGMK